MVSSPNVGKIALSYLLIEGIAKKIFRKISNFFLQIQGLFQKRCKYFWRKTSKTFPRTFCQKFSRNLQKNFLKIFKNFFKQFFNSLQSTFELLFNSIAVGRIFYFHLVRHSAATLVVKISTSIVGDFEQSKTDENYKKNHWKFFLV